MGNKTESVNKECEQSYDAIVELLNKAGDLIHMTADEVLLYEKLCDRAQTTWEYPHNQPFSGRQTPREQ